MLSISDDSRAEERSGDLTESLAERRIADSGASFHMTRSADLLSDVRLCDDKGRIGDNHLIDVVGYVMLTVVFPGDLTVKLLDVAYVPDLAFNLFSLMAAHKQGVGFMTEEEDVCISLFDGRLRFKGDGVSPLAFPVLTPGRNAPTETAVDINVFHCVHGHANEVLLRETASRSL
ncbi:unnamed protein product [Laminaria digitata]